MDSYYVFQPGQKVSRSDLSMLFLFEFITLGLNQSCCISVSDSFSDSQIIFGFPHPFGECCIKFFLKSGLTLAFSEEGNVIGLFGPKSSELSSFDSHKGID